MGNLNTYIDTDDQENGCVDAARDPGFLTLAGSETLGFDFKGSTDVLVASRLAILNCAPDLEMRLLFKLQKKSPGAALNQARLSVLLANLHSPETKPALVSLESGLSLMRSVTSHKLASMQGVNGIMIVFCFAPEMPAKYQACIHMNNGKLACIRCG